MFRRLRARVSSCRRLPTACRLTQETAFSVQNAAATTLLAADTQNMQITIAGSLSLSGHIITTGTVPTIAAGAAACTTPTVSVAGTDTAGLITVTTGTGCAATGNLATLTFATAFGAAPRVVVSPANAVASALQTYIDSAAISTTKFDIGTGTVPTSSTTYKWYYHVIQ